MFDAILLASYGGPEKTEDVDPFLDRVLQGKRVPRARRDVVRERYERFGGKSPLPQECRDFLTKLKEGSRESENAPHLYWGNLFSPPTFDDALAQAEKDKIASVLVFATSPLGSTQSCARYRKAVLEALCRRSKPFARNLRLAFVPPFFDRPVASLAVADELLKALAMDDLECNLFSDSDREEPTRRLLLFTAHSLPTVDGITSQYRRQLVTLAATALREMLSAPGFGGRKLEKIDFLKIGDRLPEDLERELNRENLTAGFAFQSRSGSPAIPWLEPSPSDFLRQFKKNNPGLRSVIVSPIGFFFDNMETIWDLDVELRATCDELSVSFRKAECCGASRRFVDELLNLARQNPEDFPQCDPLRGICDLSCKSSPKTEALEKSN
ncbi:MAG: ferrochelatase [Thermoguttaceae bacterium]|nr:ferrochelatase [Thermoguttaceae bacterium]